MMVTIYLLVDMGITGCSRLPELSVMNDVTSADRSAMHTTIVAFVAHEELTGYSPRTIDRRRNTVELFATALNGAEPTREAVEVFLTARRSQETRRGYLGDLRRFYTWAMTRDLADVDPTVGIQTPRVPVRDPTPLTATEVAQARAACRNRQDRLVIGLGIFAGLRVSEMAHLERRDVRLDEELLVVRNGKGGKDRRVPIAPALRVDLAVEVLDANTRDGVSRRIKRIYARAGVVARAHDLRHTFATELARRSNGNLQLVAGLCGHANMQTTRRYVGYYPDGADVVELLYAA